MWVAPFRWYFVRDWLSRSRLTAFRFWLEFWKWFFFLSTLFQQPYLSHRVEYFLFFFCVEVSILYFGCVIMSKLVWWRTLVEILLISLCISRCRFEQCGVWYAGRMATFVVYFVYGSELLYVSYLRPCSLDIALMCHSMSVSRSLFRPFRCPAVSAFVNLSRSFSAPFCVPHRPYAKRCTSK